MTSTSAPPFLRRRAAQGLMTLQRADALRDGCTDAALRSWVDAGWLRRCGFGAYVLTGAVADDDPWAAKRALHLRTARAVITGLPGSYLVGSSAALAHGLTVLTVPDRIMVSRQHRVRSRRVGIHTRPAWGEGPIILDGVPVQSRTECAVQISADEGRLAGLVVADNALRVGESLTSLREAAARYTDDAIRRCRRAVMLVAEQASGMSESPLETETRMVLRDAGFDVDEQVEIRDERGAFVARVDLMVHGTRIIIEVDGLSKYADRDVLRAEKVREEKLRRLGYVVIRVLAADLRRPEHVLQAVRAALTSLAA